MDTSTYKSEVAAAFNSAAATYDRLGVEFFTPMGRRLVERAAPAVGARVLDVGCGRGACVFPAAERVGPEGRVVGIDVAEAMIEEATKEAALRDAAMVELRVMDGEHPDFAPHSFDVVLGSYSVIFLPDAPTALARYAPLLSPGGRLAFTSPVFSDDTFPFLPPVFTELIPRELLLDLPPQWQPEQLQQRFNSWLADPRDLTRTLERCGFQEVTVVDEPVTLVAESGLAWVDWSHTQGMRLLWNHLAPDKRQQLRERLITSLDAMRDGGGPLTIETPVRYVTATVGN
ncbi:class I SAM-dependent methyltransferase [Streptomyces sp. ID05-47C]|uniref:class I SAM-dependent methyltransferase n=1 Tax=Streptomyces sp. ID05-47C TaxID=3028665 RepID=UPI0029A1BD01|nr:methyltransferase domain-containing protein [Streptomyces sp. ID05-47C]MDX3568358.1 methyltransferase domain-containing protein [Streptomyces sp. ID05-47C]